MKPTPNESTVHSNRRRRLRFSLRSLFVLVLIVASLLWWLGVKLEQAQRQREAIASIAAMGGIFFYDYQCDAEGNNIRGELPWHRAWLCDTFGNDFVLDVVHVNWQPKWAHVDLDALSGLPNLKAVFLAGPAVTDENLAHLRQIHAIRSLAIMNAPASNDGLAACGLEGQRYLQHLYLQGTDIDDEGLALLANLRQLKSLRLARSDITDAGLEHLSSLRTLEFLDLGYSPISGDGLVNLQSLPNLRILGLRGTKVTDRQLVHLERIETLEEISLEDTQVTKAGVEKLRHALPGCRISWDGSMDE